MARGAKGIAAIKDVLAGATEAPDLTATLEPGGPDPRDDTSDDGEHDRPFLPKTSPVRALGMKGQRCFYLDVQGQLIDLAPKDHGKNNVTALFTPLTHLPLKYWPVWAVRKNPITDEQESYVKGFDQVKSSEALIRACGEAGIFDARGRVRGRGAHAGKAGALILHTGDKVYVAANRVDGSAGERVWHEPGLIDGFVYPAAAPSPRPDPDPATVEDGEGLLATLQTWNWQRPMLDPMLALGWAGQAFVCGALGWRSHLFITGGKGTGKSTLNGKGGLFDRLLGTSALRTGNASEAAIRQTLGAQTIPVIFDEFEASEFNPQRTKAIVELARVASSGAEMHRGGADHNAHEFVLASAMQFSAILMPEMQPQDRSRFAVLELQSFPPTPIDADPAEARGIDLERLRLPQLGKRLARRMVDGWPRFGATLNAYRRALEDGGHSSRAADQFGTLLACADLLLYDDLPDRDLLAHWAGMCAPDGLSEISGAVEEHDACLDHLLTSSVQARGGDERETVGAWVQKALETGPDNRSEAARRHLANIGVRLVTIRPTKAGALGATEHRLGYDDNADTYLAIAKGHLGIEALFRDTHWRRGVWGQALERTPGKVLGIKAKFAGRSLNAVCVPLGAALDLDDAGGAA